MKVKIDNKDFLFFNNFAVILNLDSIASSFSFIGKFNPQNAQHRELFKPLSFKSIQVFRDDNTLLLTGTVVDFKFVSNSEPQLVKISGYSKGGILEDVNIPYTSYPLESLKRSLTDIAQNLLSPFSLNMIVEESAKADMELIYEKSIAFPAQSVKDYLSKLTSQRNIVLSHNEKGDIIFTKPKFTEPSKFLLNKENTIEMTLNVKSQAMQSQIWVLRQPSFENNNLSPVDTIENPLLSAFRPGVRMLSSGTDTDTAKAVKNVMATQVKNISVSVKLNTWLDLRAGDIVEVQNEEIYLYDRVRFVVSSLRMNQNESFEEMELSLTLPEAFTGEPPQKIFG